MRTRSLLVLVAGLAALLLSACADGAGDPESSPTPPGETLVPPRPPTDLPPPPSPPTLPTLPGGEVELAGNVIEGVEPGCIVLATEQGEFLLFGEASEEIQVGGSVTVRGEPRPDMATTCQQGIPFEVSEVIG